MHMGSFDFRNRYFIPCLVLIVVVFLPTLYHAQDFVCSRATYFGSPKCPGNPRGACGYGELGTSANNGNVAAVSRLYKGGAGCGACYQVRCKAPGICTDDGVKVVATDHGGSDWADFILSPKAYTAMAKSGSESELQAYGVVDIEFRRVPCDYAPGTNLVIRVYERSRYPHYLAILLIYQAGFYDIVAAEYWQEDCKQWRPMRKPFGAAWDVENPPKGALPIRFKLVSSVSVSDFKWVELDNAIPDGWEGGATYDTGVQLD